jgi:hypothetical protein
VFLHPISFPFFSLSVGLFRFGEALALALDCLLEVRSCERAAFRLSCPWAWNWPERDGMGRNGMEGGCLHRGQGGTHLRSGPPNPPLPNLRLRLRSRRRGCASRVRFGDVDVPAEKGNRGMRWDAGVDAGAVPLADRPRGCLGVWCKEHGWRSTYPNAVIQKN